MVLVFLPICTKANISFQVDNVKVTGLVSVNGVCHKLPVFVINKSKILGVTKTVKPLPLDIGHNKKLVG